MDNQLYVCVGIEIATEKCVGVDFCKDEDQLRFKADMFRRDFGDGYLILEYPSREASVVEGFAALAVEATTAAAQNSLFGALQRQSN
jgi:hypothetical protein